MKVETPLRNEPTVKVETPLRNEPTVKVETPLRNEPTVKVETPLRNEPTVKVETPLRNEPTVKVETPLRNEPTVKVETPLRNEPTVRSETSAAKRTHRQRQRRVEFASRLQILRLRRNRRAWQGLSRGRFYETSPTPGCSWGRIRALERRPTRPPGGRAGLARRWNERTAGGEVGVELRGGAETRLLRGSLSLSSLHAVALQVAEEVADLGFV